MRTLIRKRFDSADSPHRFTIFPQVTPYTGPSESLFAIHAGMALPLTCNDSLIQVTPLTGDCGESVPRGFPGGAR